MNGDYLPLSDVSEQTHVSVRKLREWCATGRLSCERIGDSWALHAADVEDLVRELASHDVHATRDASLALPAEVATPQAEREIADALGVGRGEIAVARLMIDGMEYVVLAAHADADAIEAARGVVERYGGQLLDP